MPRGSKVTQRWQKKREKSEPPYRKVKLEMKKYQPSAHPMVGFVKEIEASGVTGDAKVAAIAGFQAGHCTDARFNTSKQIAIIRLPDGRIKRTYACDVCGFVGSKVSHT